MYVLNTPSADATCTKTTWKHDCISHQEQMVHIAGLVNVKCLMFENKISYILYLSYVLLYIFAIDLSQNHSLICLLNPVLILHIWALLVNTACLSICHLTAIKDGCVHKYGDRLHMYTHFSWIGPWTSFTQAYKQQSQSTWLVTETSNIKQPHLYSHCWFNTDISVHL